MRGETRKYGWPWGTNEPTRRRRVIFAITIALVSAGILYAAHPSPPGRTTDFDQIWFASRAMLEGRNPYSLIGPGREFDAQYPLFYPPSALVAAIPLVGLSKQAAAIAMVAVSVFLLCYGMTVDSWHRIPMLVSASFVESVGAAQWSILLTAVLFLPWLAAFVSVKPQTGIPPLAGNGSKTAFWAALIGTALLLGASFYYLPNWPRDWMQSLRSTSHIRSPLISPAGILILLVLLRWRRREAWLVFLAAALPQTFMWYSVLALLAIAGTYKETITLSLISSLGFAIVAQHRWELSANPSWAIYVLSTFVPAVVVILKRPNKFAGIIGEAPQQ